MANNAYLVGGQCTPSVVEYLLSVCPAGTHRITLSATAAGLEGASCFDASRKNLGYRTVGAPNCELQQQPDTPSDSASGIPTVADGVSLGWSVGSALILTAAILSVRKALL